MPPSKTLHTLLLLTALATPLRAQQPPTPTPPLEKQNNAIILPLPNAFLKLEVIADDIIRVAYAPNRDFFNHPSFATSIKTITLSTFTITRDPQTITLTTPKLKAQIDTQTGTVTFLDPSGKIILAEMPNGRTLDPAEVQAEHTHHARQQWLPDPTESLYGLGQHQYGLLNIKGHDIELWQHNTEIAVPFLVSSKGYGLFWDNPSYTKFGDPRDYQPIPADHLFDATGKPGGFTATPFTDRAMTQSTTPHIDTQIRNGDPEHRSDDSFSPPGDPAIVWEGQLLADVTGDYHFALYANGGFKMWIDDQLVIDHWRQNWLPWDDLAKAHFDAHSKHHIKVQWIKDGCDYCTLTWKPPLAEDAAHRRQHLASGPRSVTASTTTSSTAPSLDRVIAGYRQLTGKAPMMPQWAFGLWQSRQRYETPAGITRRRQRIPRRATSPSTTSCRTGCTGARTTGAPTTSTPHASPIPTSGSRTSTPSTPTS